MRSKSRCSSTSLLVLLTVSLFPPAVLADSFKVTVFATGTSYTQPDSISVGDGSIWVAYTNGAASDGSKGSSTVVRYSPTGAVLNTYTIKGSVDGLKVDPSTGLVWALQNQDANPAVTLINPVTNTLTPLAYQQTFPGRGYDDVVFSDSQTFLSETNPSGPSDPTIVELTNSTSPLMVSTILTKGALGLNLATGKTGPTIQNDPDSLKLGLNGTLVLTSGDDGTLTFVAHPAHPGSANQSVSFIQLLNAAGQDVSGLDDSTYATATAGTFYLAATNSNTVYAIQATSLTLDELFASVGSENALGAVNLSTGLFTPVVGGLAGPHGLAFVAATPEPGTVVLMLTGVALIFVGGRLRRHLRG